MAAVLPAPGAVSLLILTLLEAAYAVAPAAAVVAPFLLWVLAERRGRGPSQAFSSPPSCILFRHAVRLALPAAA